MEADVKDDHILCFEILKCRIEFPFSDIEFLFIERMQITTKDDEIIITGNDVTTGKEKTFKLVGNPVEKRGCLIIDIEIFNEEDPNLNVDTILNLKFREQNELNRVNDWIKRKKKSIQDKNAKDKSDDSSPVSLEMLIEAFNAKMEFCHDLKESAPNYLSTKIRKYLQQNKYTAAGQYYAPFTAICQSSGIGKSRACLELTDHFYVVFICLRNNERFGYPRRSHIADYFTQDYDNLNSANGFFCTFFNYFFDLFKQKDADKIYQDQIKNNFNHGIQCKVSIDLLQIIQPYKNYDRPHTCPDLGSYENEEGKKPIVFIFDEASALTKENIQNNLMPSNFLIIRKLLKNRKDNIFFLFLDTFSVLSQFMPYYFNDPSLRPNEQIRDNIKLFDPIYLLPSWDAFANYDLIKNIQDTILFSNICRFGRPLWFSLYKVKIDDQNKGSKKFGRISKSFIKDLAEIKLVGGVKPQYEFTDYMAILGVRIGAIKTKLSHTNQQLVANNMAVCVHANIEKGIFEIDYPSEPLLADSAAYYWAKETFNLDGTVKSTFDELIETLNSSISSSVVDQGDNGENIAKIILLKAMDTACRNSKTSSADICNSLKYIHVGEFLRVLYGSPENCKSSQGTSDWTCDCDKSNCVIKLICSQYTSFEKTSKEDYANKLLNGFINFNHFTKSDCYFEKKTKSPDQILIRALKRCAAIHCKINQTGIDLLIPVALNSNDFSEITGIMIQVKLRKDIPNTTYEQAFEKINFSLNPGDKRQPYLMLFMELFTPIEASKEGSARGRSTKRSKFDRFTDLKETATEIDTKSNSEDLLRSIIITKHISQETFPFLDQDKANRLAALSNAKPDLAPKDKFEATVYRQIRYAIKDD